MAPIMPIRPAMERTAYEIEPVLRAVARTMQACLGFGTVVVNLHWPAWDDFETVVVEGSADAREVLLGQTASVALAGAGCAGKSAPRRRDPALTGYRVSAHEQRGRDDARLRADHRAAGG
jgi:hypothetical protein